MAFAVIGAEGRGNRNIHLDVSMLRRGALAVGAVVVSAALLLPLSSSDRLENLGNPTKVEQHVQGTRVVQSQARTTDPTQNMKDGLIYAGKALQNGNPIGFVASAVYVIANAGAAMNDTATGPARKVEAPAWHFSWNVPPTSAPAKVADLTELHPARKAHEHHLRVSRRRD